MRPSAAGCKIACRTYVLSGPVPSLAPVIDQTKRKDLAQRCLSAVDLAIDFATLGEYGLEPLPTDGTCRGRAGRQTGWEAPATARRGSCPQPEAEPRPCGRLG